MRRKTLAFFLLAAIVLCMAPPAAGLWVFHQLESRLQSEISGRYSPAFFLPAFSIQDATVEWDGKIRVENGDVKVEYDVPALLLGHGLRVRLSGEKLPVTLRGSWAEQVAKEKIVFDKFYADFTLGRKGIREINAVEVSSPEFSFHIGLSS